MTRTREHLVLVGTCDEEQPERWRQSWADHQGALPPDTVLDATCVLDWVGPVVAALGDASPRAFEMHRHDDEQIKALSAKIVRKPHLTETQTYFAQLKAISPAPADDPAATRVIDRL